MCRVDLLKRNEDEHTVDGRIALSNFSAQIAMLWMKWISLSQSVPRNGHIRAQPISLSRPIGPNLPGLFGFWAEKKYFHFFGNDTIGQSQFGPRPNRLHSECVLTVRSERTGTESSERAHCSCEAGPFPRKRCQKHRDEIVTKLKPD